MIFNRYVLWKCLKVAIITMFALSIMLAWPLIDDVPAEGINKYILLTCSIPYTMYLTLPLVLALAWIIARNSLIISGEWHGLQILGWAPRRVIFSLWLVGILGLWITFAISESKYIKTIQQNQITEQYVPMSNKMLHKTQEHTRLITIRPNTIEITQEGEYSMHKEIFKRGSSAPNFTINIKHFDGKQQLIFNKFVNYDFLSMLVLASLLLFVAIVSPTKYSRWPLFNGMMVSISLFVLNIELMHWALGIGVLPFLFPAAMLLLLLIPFIYGGLDAY